MEKKDRKTDVQKLKNSVKEFCVERNWDQYHGAKDLAIGIITEASELLEHFRFKSEDEVEALFKDPRRKARISEEVADVLFFVLRLTQRYEIDLSSAL